MLGRGKRAQAVWVGFPLIGLRASFGVTSWLETGLVLETNYGALNEARARLKWGALTWGGWALSLALEGGAAYFPERALVERRGARWMTGRRNANAAAAAVFSYQGEHARAVRLFGELRYTAALDAEPFVTQPLTSPPSSLVWGHNLSLGGGAELPVTASVSFSIGVGVELHGRGEDSRVMPTCGVGLVSGF